MINPFYVNHLKRLMDGDTAAQENVIPQLFDWATEHRMSGEDFAACMNLILDRVEQAAIVENESFVDHCRQAIPLQSDAERTLTSIAAILGWGNVPPQHVMEQEIKILRDRALAAPAYA